MSTNINKYLKPILELEYALGHVSNLRSLGYQEPCQEHPYPPSQGWILGALMVPDIHITLLNDCCSLQ